MKNVLLLLCALQISFNCCAQVQKGFHYKIKPQYQILPRTKIYKPIIWYKSDTSAAAKDVLPTEIKIHPRGNQKLKAGITQDKKKPERLIIDLWSVGTFNGVAGVDDTKYILPTTKPGRVYYEVAARNKLGDAPNFISIPFATVEAGVATIPVKFRFGHDDVPSDVSTKLNAGLYVSRKWGRTRFFRDSERTSNSIAFSWAGFIGPSPVELTASNTEPTARVEGEKKINMLALTLGTGFQLSKDDISLGILGGWDLPISEKKYKWVYRNYPWIGFGVGYKLSMFSAAE